GVLRNVGDADGLDGLITREPGSGGGLFARRGSPGLLRISGGAPTDFRRPAHWRLRNLVEQLPAPTDCAGLDAIGSLPQRVVLRLPRVRRDRLHLVRPVGALVDALALSDGRLRGLVVLRQLGSVRRYDGIVHVAAPASSASNAWSAWASVPRC